MTFDPENHLTNVPGMMQAGYDSEGLQAWKQGSSTQGPAPPVYYLYDGDTAIVEEDVNGNVLSWNGYGADGLRTRYTANPAGGASQTQHYAFDPTGNLSNRLDPNGVASNSTVYDAFGALRGQINTTTGQPEVNPDPVGFSGQWGGYTDPESKLVLLTHRYYDPSHGRWLNRDPIGYSGGLNLYGYCGNNPVSKIDPNGTDAYGYIFFGNTYNGAIEAGAYDLIGTHAMIGVDTPRGFITASWDSGELITFFSKDKNHPGRVDPERSSTFYGGSHDVCHGYRLKQTAEQDALIVKHILGMIRYKGHSISEKELFTVLYEHKGKYVFQTPNNTWNTFTDNCTTEANDALVDGRVWGICKGEWLPRLFDEDFNNYMAGTDPDVKVTRLDMKHD